MKGQVIIIIFFFFVATDVKLHKGGAQASLTNIISRLLFSHDNKMSCSGLITINRNKQKQQEEKEKEKKSTERQLNFQAFMKVRD